MSEPFHVNFHAFFLSLPQAVHVRGILGPGTVTTKGPHQTHLGLFALIESKLIFFSMHDYCCVRGKRQIRSRNYIGLVWFASLKCRTCKFTAQIYGVE